LKEWSSSLSSSIKQFKSRRTKLPIVHAIWIGLYSFSALILKVIDYSILWSIWVWIVDKKNCVFRAWSVVGRCTLAVYHAACSKDFRCSKESFIIEFCSKINTETCWQYRPTAICGHASGYLYLFLCCMIYFYIIPLSFFIYKFYCYMSVLISKYFANLFM